MIEAVSLSLGTRHVLYSQQRTAAPTNETTSHLCHRQQGAKRP